MANTKKFSQFVGPSALQAGDILAGLRGGVNYQFTYAAQSLLPWTFITTDTNAAVNNGYFSGSASLVTITLPVTASVGDTIRVAGYGAGGWKIAQNASQKIYFGTSSTTTGTGGSLASTNTNDVVELVCVVANNEYVALSSIGSLTVV